MPHFEINVPSQAFLPIYQHTLNSDYDIEFLYGSRDSGKSQHVAQTLVYKCILGGKSFNCALIRKVFNTIKDSQWAMIKNVVERWKLDQFFKFSTHPLEIRCVTGGRFIARGMDDPYKIKSLTNPSDAWVEELTDLDATDWTLLTTSLRSSDGRTQVWGSFNPDIREDYEDNWLYRLFFAHTEQLSFENTITVKLMNDQVARIRYRATHSTFYDNPFCPPERKAVYESLKDPYEYMVYAKGMWGRKKTGGEYLSSFVFQKHVKHLQFDPNTAMRFSLDNNVKPYIAITGWQAVKTEKGYVIRQIVELPGIEPNNRASRAAKGIIQYLQKINYAGPVYLHGDKSTKSRNTIDDNARSFYQIINETIQNAGFRTVDGFINFAPSVVAIGDFINAILDEIIPGLEIEIDHSCKLSIKDYISTKTDKDGTILKTLVDDPSGEGKYQKNGHMTDTLKDFIVQCFYTEFQLYTNRHKKLIPGGVSQISRLPPVTL